MKRSLVPRYDDDTVLDILRRQDVFLCADCGGRGVCGRCRIRFTEDDKVPEPTEEELKVLSEEDLASGIRLACQTHLDKRTEIEIPSSSLIHEGGAGEIDVRKVVRQSKSEVIAVDYGTTMISGALVDLNKGVIGEASVINHQKAYGADVISRIKASNDGYSEELRRVSMGDLAELCERLGRDPEEARYIVSGNTVMEHLLSGLSCKGLGEYPYTPADISLRRDDDITFLPGISAFVGADIVSGICACSLDKAKSPWLYIDIGTNGEMALGTGETIIAASAPAGPAFEGGNLSCGMPAFPGAVCSCELAGEKAVARTVGDIKACGICGSGAVDVIASLLKNRFMDINGTLIDRYAEGGFQISGDVVLTQRDIREIQKAKAAIRAGIETLVSESGLKYSDIGKLVIAGSFGQEIDMENACRIGLIPEELLGAAATAGNASLSGAVLYALDMGFRKRLEDVAGSAEQIELSLIPEFGARYVSQMGF